MLFADVSPVVVVVDGIVHSENVYIQVFRASSFAVVVVVVDGIVYVQVFQISGFAVVAVVVVAIVSLYLNIVVIVDGIVHSENVFQVSGSDL